MKQTETEHLSFNVYEAAPGVEWPSTNPPVSCIGKNRGGDKVVDIIRGPVCKEADLDNMKERFENDWRERNGLEVAANGLRFHRR